jgi:integrase
MQPPQTDLGRAVAYALDPVLWTQDVVGWTADPWQVNLLRSQDPQIALNCGRQVGKSSAVGVLASHTAVFDADSLILLIAPSQRQSRELAIKVSSFLGSIEPHEELEESQKLSITLARTKSRIVALPGHDPKTLRESGRAGLVPSRPACTTAEGSRWHAILATAALAGLRSSELRGLMWSDVDLTQVTIHVQRRADENNEMGPPKSEAGDRVIQVSSLLTNILKRWKLVCPKGELGLCFPTGIGTVESHANIANRAWYKFQADLGIVKPATYEDGKPIMEPVLDEKGKPVIGANGKPEMRQSSRPKYGLHAARHFFASCMIEAGHLPKRLQEMMGHASLQMTYDRYGHLFPAGDGERAKLESAADFLHATKTA